MKQNTERLYLEVTVDEEVVHIISYPGCISCSYMREKDTKDNWTKLQRNLCEAIRNHLTDYLVSSYNPPKYEKED